MSQVERKPTWLVLRTYNRKEMEISSFLQQNGLRHFIPMTYQERFSSTQAKPRRVLVPVIHNYVFLEKSDNEAGMRTLLANCRIPLQFMKQHDTGRLCEISDRDMVEFRLLCDPDYCKTPIELFEAEQTEVLPGREVKVVHGPFAGIHGKLHKKNQKYWFIKTIGGISVMMRISRWYCKPIEKMSNIETT